MSSGQTSEKRLRSSIAWSFAGSSTLALSQWLLLAAVARLSGSEDVGRVALGLAITAPVFLFTNLNFKVVRASDAAGRWTGNDFFHGQVRMLTLAYIIIAAMVLFAPIGQSERYLLATLSLAKGAESMSNNHYGLFQRRKRMDLVGRSMVARGLLGGFIAVALFAVVGAVWIVGAGLAIAWSAVLFLHDRRVAARLQENSQQPLGNQAGKLIRAALPLGVDGGLNSLTINVPRYMLTNHAGLAEFGVFASLAYLGQIVILVSGAVGDSIVPVMADQLHEGRQRQFERLQKQLWIFAGGVAVAGFIAAVTVGPVVMRIMFGEAFVDVPLLAIVMASMGIVTLHRLQTRTLQAANRFRMVLATNVVLFAVSCGASLILIPRFDLIGAAAVQPIAFGVASVVSLAAVRRTFKDQERQPPQRPAI